MTPVTCCSFSLNTDDLTRIEDSSCRRNAVIISGNRHEKSSETTDGRSSPALCCSHCSHYALSNNGEGFMHQFQTLEQERIVNTSKQLNRRLKFN